MPKEPHKYQGLEERMSDHKNADGKGPTQDLRATPGSTPIAETRRAALSTSCPEIEAASR